MAGQYAFINRSPLSRISCMDTAIIFMGRRAILAAVLKRGASEANWAGIRQGEPAQVSC